MKTIDLTDKTVLVTGGSQGLGESMARAMYACGANVTLNYFPDPALSNKHKAEAVAESMADRCIVFGADVRDPHQVQRMFEQSITHFGGLHVLVNNAGILRDRSIKKMTETEWQEVIDTNLSGVFHCCKQAALHLRDGGRIINIASLSAEVGFFGQANYTAAKAGVIGLTKVLSKELAGRKILVNAIAPGVIATEMADTIPEEQRQAMLTQIPLGRFGAPDDIANVALFLASDLSNYITGQTIHVNGGWWG
jgi:3-oxoacyl-[acyl-carrier protein] reductase